MMKQFSYFLMIGLGLLVIVMHLLRLVSLHFKPQFLERFKIISQHQLSKQQLTLYYLGAIAVCYVGLSSVLSRM